MEKESQSVQIEPGVVKRLPETDNTLTQEEVQSGVRQIYIQDKVIRTAIDVEIQFDPEIYELLKAVSYRDGLDDPIQLSKLQIESFVERAVREKIDRCLKDYTKLGEIHSRRLQRKHKHLVTLKEVPNPDSYGGLGTKLVPLEDDEKKREYIGFS